MKISMNARRMVKAATSMPPASIQMVVMNVNVRTVTQEVDLRAKVRYIPL